MPIQIENTSEGVVIIRAIGKLVKEDYAAFASQFEQIVSESGRLRILFDMTRFTGWDSKGLWEEAKFDFRHNRDISRLAVVGDPEWQHALVDMVKPFAAAEVRYFHSDESSQARPWLLQ